MNIDIFKHSKLEYFEQIKLIKEITLNYDFHLSLNLYNVMTQQLENYLLENFNTIEKPIVNEGDIILDEFNFRYFIQMPTLEFVLNENIKYFDLSFNEFMELSEKTEIIQTFESILINTILKDELKYEFFDKNIKCNLDSNVAKKHEHIFSNNGFVLFEYILKEYVKTKRGRLSDIHFFYRSMYNNKPQYIQQRPERFKEWFFENYNNEDLGKIKTLNEVSNPDRIKHYSNALDWFKTQK